MSLQLMKERMKISGTTPREEMIRDGQNLLKEELEHDTSYSPTMYFYDAENEKDDRLANFRVYGRKRTFVDKLKKELAKTSIFTKICLFIFACIFMFLLSIVACHSCPLSHFHHTFFLLLGNTPAGVKPLFFS